MFISTSLLKVDTSCNLSFKDFSKTIATSSLSMLRHQKYNYQYILDDEKKKDPSVKNLYDIIISYQITKATSSNSDIPYHTKWYGTDYIGNTLDVHFHDNDNSGNLLVEYDYQIAKLDETDISSMHDRILFIIEQILNNPDICIHDIDIVTPYEKNVILNKFNTDFNKFYPTNDIIEKFKNIVNENPNKVALVFNDEKISYKKLDAMSDT